MADENEGLNFGVSAEAAARRQQQLLVRLCGSGGIWGRTEREGRTGERERDSERERERHKWEILNFLFLACLFACLLRSTAPLALPVTQEEAKGA